jgi:hypothetical protein
MSVPSLIPLKPGNALDQLDTAVQALVGANRRFEAAPHFKLTDNMAEAEALDLRTDIFAGVPADFDFRKLLDSCLQHYKGTQGHQTALFDLLLEQFLVFLEGKTIFHNLFLCALYHDTHRFQEMTFESVVLAAFNQLATDAFAVGSINGSKNHADFEVWYLPKLRVATAEWLREGLAQLDKKLATPSLKLSSDLTRKEAGGEKGYQFGGWPACSSQISVPVHGLEPGPPQNGHLRDVGKDGRDHPGNPKDAGRHF